MDLVTDPARVGAIDMLNVWNWNGHPIDASPARHLLLKLGFVAGSSRWKGLVYDGTCVPDPDTAAQAEGEMPTLFEHAGKEAAPAVYDAEWIVSRSPAPIRGKVGQLVAFLEKVLPAEGEIRYYPRGLTVFYRGLRCVSPWVAQGHLYLHITHRGWVPGIKITHETDLTAPEFLDAFHSQFENTLRHIDALLDSRQARVRATH